MNVSQLARRLRTAASKFQGAGWETAYAVYLDGEGIELPKSVLRPISTLEQILRGAKVAHSLYEEVLGHPDEDWDDWYARYIKLYLD